MIFVLDELLRVLNYIKENGSSDLVKLSIFNNDEENAIPLHLEYIVRLNFEEFGSCTKCTYAGGNVVEELPF